MIEDVDALVAGAKDEFAKVGLPLNSLTHELRRAPHEIPKLPKGRAAIYVFSLSKEYKTGVLAGANRVLKVGRCASTNRGRFHSWHYQLQKSSSLARSLLGLRVLWAYLGIEDLTEVGLESWMKQNLDRDHFFIDTSEEPQSLVMLEKYIRGIVGSVYEGSSSTVLILRQVVEKISFKDRVAHDVIRAETRNQEPKT